MNKAQLKFWGSNGMQTQDSNSLSYTHHLILHMTCFQRGFIAQLVEHRTGIADVMGSNPVGAWESFLGFICNCLSYYITVRIIFTHHFKAIWWTSVWILYWISVYATLKPRGFLAHECVQSKDTKHENLWVLWTCWSSQKLVRFWLWNLTSSFWLDWYVQRI